MDQKYPKSYRENLEYRFQVMNLCEKDEAAREIVKEWCQRDIRYFFNVGLWTYDPRTESKGLPFITYEFQDEYIENLLKAYRDQKDMLTEKSRDMGATWMALGVILYLWLYESKFTGLLGSYIEDLVDNKTIDSHFGRFEFMLDRLPWWLKPKGFEMSKHRNSMKLENPNTGGLLTGYAPTERFSRAGRYSLIFADEFAFWKHARSAWTAMGDATRCRLVTSTVNGKGNKFAELALKSSIWKERLHWRLHPLKTEEWYEEEKSRRTEEEVAQELDINYNKSITDKVYPEFDEYNYLEKQEYNPAEPLFVSWDFGLRDPTALIWFQRSKDGIVRVIDAYQKANVTIDYFVPFVGGELKSLRKYKYEDEEIEMIERHKDWQDAVHFGDPTGENDNQTSGAGKNVIRQLRDLGIYVQTNRQKFKHRERIQSTKMLIRRLRVDKDLLELIDALENYRYPKKADLSQSTEEIVKPVHDWTSHYCTALEYFAVNENVKKLSTLVKRVKGEAENIVDNIFKLRPKSKPDKLKSKPKYRTCA